MLWTSFFARVFGGLICLIVKEVVGNNLGA